MFLDDAFHHRETQAGPLSNVFGGKKRIEDFCAGLFRHAMTGIGDLKAHVIAFTREVQPKTPSLRHGMETVHHEIDDHLDELVLIGMDIGQ